jgi:hypothetical protein
MSRQRWVLRPDAPGPHELVYRTGHGYQEAALLLAELVLDLAAVVAGEPLDGVAMSTLTGLGILETTAWPRATGTSDPHLGRHKGRHRPSETGTSTHACATRTPTPLACHEGPRSSRSGPPTDHPAIARTWRLGRFYAAIHRYPIGGHP